jgi:HAD superfamily hydrolase (TIGR01509 family)
MIRVVIFDLDFTLIDSSAAVVQCARVGFAKAGLPCPEDAVVIGAIGMSFQEFARRHAGSAAPEVIAGFREESHRLGWLDTVVLLPHAMEVLAELKQRGLRLGLATQKSRPALEAILAHLQLTEYFDAMVSGDCIANRKPAPDSLLECARRLQAAPAEAIYVGDHPYDILASRAAGMRIAAVAAGPTPKEELERMKPDWLVDNVAEVGRICYG